LQGSRGHGIDFFAEPAERQCDANLIAVIRGFEALLGRSNEVEIFIRPPDDVYDAVFLAEAQRAIEEFMAERRIGPRQIAPSLFAWFNA